MESPSITRPWRVTKGPWHTVIIPYPKGIHLTLDSWRPGQDSDGWKLTSLELQVVL
jgi:hypothetical protein